MFYNILKRKKPLSPIKTKFPKRQKMEIFPKGLTHFWSKNWTYFDLFFLSNISQKNVFYDILKRKNAFLGYKNSRKIEIFPKRIFPCFGSKNGLFSIFFLSNIGQENVCYDILEQKNDFLGYKHKEFKKSKN